MDWTDLTCTSITTCISIYAAGLLVISTAFSIYCSHEISRRRFEQGEYVILMILLMAWPYTLILAALCGIGYVIGRTPYVAMKWWMEKCAKLTENWKERKRQNGLEKKEEERLK